MAYTTVDDPSLYFHIQTWTGTSDDSTKTITNSANAGDFKPDWLWIKARSGTYSTRDNALYDSSRGATARLESNATDAEATDSNNVFNTNGFTLTANYSINGPSTNHVGWQWKVNGGTTSSNSNGSITTTVQANTSAGISIVLYTSASGGQTIGHGLGVVPEMYWIKKRNAAGDDWFVYHSALGEGKKIRLSGNNGQESDTNIWQNTAPTTTVASLQNDGGGVNVSTGGTKNYVGYFFNSVKGYSKIGSYSGNGDADGTFVYTGFRPAWLLFKESGANGEHWRIFDSTGSTSNQVDDHLFASTNSAESAETGCDFLSNGFKWRNSDNHQNGSSKTYIYMAFAEHPFVSSKGAPVTAR